MIDGNSRLLLNTATNAVADLLKLARLGWRRLSFGSALRHRQLRVGREPPIGDCDRLGQVGVPLRFCDSHKWFEFIFGRCRCKARIYATKLDENSRLSQLAS